MFYGLPVCHRLPGVSCPSRRVTDYPLFHGLPDVSQSARSVTLMSEWQTGKTAASLLLQRLGRVGAGSAEGLPQDGKQGGGEYDDCCC